MGVSGCAVNLIIAILLLLQCEPLERQWNDRVPGSCPQVLRTTNAGYVAGGKFFLSFFLSFSLISCFTICSDDDRRRQREGRALIFSLNK